MSTSSAGKIPRPPEHFMRYMLHSRAKTFVFWSLAGSLLTGIAHFCFYVVPLRNQYREYMMNYDAYAELQRICNYPKKYMITCPDVLINRAKEKGVKVADDPFAPKMKEEEASFDKETENSNSVESFNG